MSVTLTSACLCPFPSQILPTGLAPEGETSPPAALKTGKSSQISQPAQKEVQKELKQGSNSMGTGAQQSRQPWGRDSTELPAETKANAAARGTSYWGCGARRTQP